MVSGRTTTFDPKIDVGGTLFGVEATKTPLLTMDAPATKLVAVSCTFVPRTPAVAGRVLLPSSFCASRPEAENRLIAPAKATRPDIRDKCIEPRDCRISKITSNTPESKTTFVGSRKVLVWSRKTIPPPLRHRTAAEGFVKIAGISYAAPAFTRGFRHSTFGGSGRPCTR